MREAVGRLLAHRFGRPAFIAAVCILARLPGLVNPLLDFHAWRQCQTAMMARNFLERGFHFFHPQVDWFGVTDARAGTEFPLYPYLVSVVGGLAGWHDVWGRVVSILFAVLTALTLDRWIGRRLDPSHGLLASLVFSLLPVSVYFTRTFQPESLALWGVVGGLAATDRWASGEGRGPGGVWTFSWGASLLALAVLHKLPYLYVIPVAWWMLWERRGVGAFPAMLMVLAVVGGASWAWYQYARSGLPVLPLGLAEYRDHIRAISEWSFWKTVFISRLPEVATTYPGFILGVAGISAMAKRGGGAWLGVWWGFIALSLIGTGHYSREHHYVLLSFAPVHAVWIAVGALAWWRRAGTAWRGFAALCLLLLPVHTAGRIHHWYRLEATWLLRAAPSVRREVPEGAGVLCDTTEPPVYLYHLHRRGITQLLEWSDPVRLDEMVRRSGVSYLFTTETDRARWSPAVSAWVDGRFQPAAGSSPWLLYRLRRTLTPKAL